MDDETRKRLDDLFNLANRRQNDPEWEQWAYTVKLALGYVLHGDPELRLGIDLALQKEGIL